MGDAAERMLVDAAGRSLDEEVVMSIREFIGHWGAQRRGYWWVQEIREDLARHSMTTVPSFEVGYIDNLVRLVKVAVASELELQASPADTPSRNVEVVETPDVEAALSVAVIGSASREVVSVKRDDSLAKAQSIMLQRDFSQLAVLASDRDLLGAISWESIAQARMHNSAKTVNECMVPAAVASLEDDLISLIPRIIAEGFIFVRQRDRKIGGLVTTADLSGEFHRLAGPFLLVGEAERRLRTLAAQTYTPAELQVAAGRDSLAENFSIASLTLGELNRVFESKERWERLGWDVDRAVFCSALDDLRRVRNDVMHFSPDPVEAQRLADVRNLVKWLKLLR